mmetsp:Transcript_3507/g.8421  ORF Transcript_3507/g.8421 Transcript_3507/m.8421 type:complete len:104 (-) Transcript_3507:119-430(-)
MLCDGLKYDKSVCESQTLTCNWIPESKVYSNAGPSAPSVSSLGGMACARSNLDTKLLGKLAGFRMTKTVATCGLSVIGLFQRLFPHIVRARVHTRIIRCFVTA